MRSRYTLRLLISNRRLRRENRRLRLELQAEQQNGRQWLEAMVDRVLTASGQYGLPPRQKASQPKKTRRIEPIEPQNEMERALLEHYQESARDAGVPAAQAIKDWQKAVTARRQMEELEESEIDERYSN